MPRFAANLTMLFPEYEFLDRFAAAANAGFTAVEYFFPYPYKAEMLAAKLSDNGLTQVLFNTAAGDWDKGERGITCHPGRKAEFNDWIDRAIHYATALHVPRVHSMAGQKPTGASDAELDATFIANLAEAANRCAPHGIAVQIEPLNAYDRPGYYLSDFGKALDLIETVTAKGGAAPKLQFDIYHCHRIHGDVVSWIERCAPHIAHYQIAGTPDRHEPDNGDLPLEAIIEAIDSITPGLCIAAEYHPANRTEEGLGWLRKFQSD
jgi:hydroxypyruvate isomerase